MNVNTSPSSGKLLQLLRLRDIEEQALVLRAAQAPRVQREYQAVLQVNPVNLLLLAEREQQSLMARFRDYLVSLTPADGTLCIHVRIRPEDTSAYRAKLERIADAHEDTAYREMADSHLAFLDELEEKAALLTRECYVRVSVTVKRQKRASSAELVERGRLALDEATESVIRGLASVGLDVTRLDDAQLVAYYLSCIHSGSAHTSSDILEAKTSLEQGQARRWFGGKRRSSHRDIIPDRVSLPELLQPSSIAVSPQAVCIHQQTDEYVRGRAVVAYPATLVPGWFEHLLALDVPAEVLLFLKTVSSPGTVRSLSRKLTSYNATALLEERQGKTPNPYIAAARTEVEEMRDKLVTKEEQVHEFSLYVLSRAESAEAVLLRDERVSGVLKGLSLVSRALQYEHLPSFLSLVDGSDILHRARKLDTSTIATAMPF